MKIILSTLLIINLLYANQTNPDSLDDLSLEELMDIKIYSATKSYQRVEEIPANIVIITKKDIKKYNYSTLDELLKYVPGLFIIDDTEHFQIGSRGSLGSSFKLMINNNPISPLRVPSGAMSNRNFFAIPVESIDRVEIIKGPQAVTYGSNSMYGSINIITNDFNEKNIASISKGNNGQEKVFARLNHKYENGGFTLNTSFYNTNGIKGDLENTLSEANYLSRNSNAVKKLDGLLENEYKTLDISHRYKNLTTDINISQTNYGIYLEPTFRNGNKVEQLEKSLSFTYEDELSSDLSYKTSFITSRKNYDINNFNINENPNLIINNYGKDIRNQVDVHFNYILNNQMKLLFGSTYKTIRHYTNQTFEQYNAYQSYDYKFYETDLYSKLQYKINDKFEVNTGIRFTKKDSFTINREVIDILSNSNIPVNSIFGKENKGYLPEVSAIYHINSRNHIKFLYGEANQLTYSGVDSYEEIKSSEINYTYLSKKYQLNTSVFYNKSENISLFTQEGTSVPISDNGTQETKGLEFAITYKPNYNFHISSSLTLQDTKAKTSSNIDIEPAFSPKVLYKINMSYKHDKTKYSLFLNYIGKMKSAIDYNTLKRYGKDSKENIVLGANLEQILSKDLSINLNVSNLLNRDNKIPAGSTLTNFHEGVYTKGREYLFTLKYKF